MRKDGFWNLDSSGTYIQSTNPSGYNILINGTNKYLNFGSVSGVGGYGFRDNSGTIEFKNALGSWTAIPTSAGTGTVTSVSVVNANGFSGTVSTATTTPAITLTTTITGILKGNGTAISAAVANTDYQSPISLTTTGTSGAATFIANVLNIPQYSGGGGSGTVTSVATDSTLTGGTITTTGTLGLNLANANSWTATQTYLKTGAIAATVYDGFDLSNTTIASSGNQMYSPAIHFTGQGWKTTATAASQSVDFREYVVPVQGTTNPTGYLAWDASVNGGAYATAMAMTTDGNLGIGTVTPSARLHINSGATPAMSQYRLTANQLGSLSQIVYSANNVASGYDTDLVSTLWTARDTTAAILYKGGTLAGYFHIDGDSGLTVGNTYTPTTRFVINLANGNTGIGTVSPSAKLHVLSTTEQIRTAYDASNYMSTTVSSVGGVTFTTTGTNGGFTLTPAGSGVNTFNTNQSGAAVSGNVFNNNASIQTPGVASFLAPNMSTGGSSFGAFMNIGKASSTNNSGAIQFTYQGAGSTSNYLNFGLYGTVGVLSIFGTSVGIGTGATVPTARLMIAAGTATASTAPLKFTSGTNLTTTEAGAIEYDGTHLYFTATNGGTRFQLDQQVGTTYSAGTGLTLTTTTFSVNTSQNIATLSNLTSNGSVQTSGSNGTLSVITNTGTGNNVLATNPTLTGASLGTSTATTQTAGDNSTNIATTAYVANAILAQNYKEAVKYATTAALASATYSNGASGVGATLTGVGLGAISVDGATPSVGDRILIKNQASTFQNGIYSVTTVGNVGVAFVLTRTTDFNQSAEINTGDTVFVSSGTVNITTTWVYSGIDAPTMGTTAITFVQTAGQGGTTATSIIPQSATPGGGITTAAFTGNTTMRVGKIHIPSAITATQLYMGINSVSTSGVVSVALFSEDGATRLFNVNTASITTSGGKTTTISAAIPAGYYYIAFLPNSTSSITFYMYTGANGVDTFYNSIGGSKGIFNGTVTVTADTIPTTITPSTITVDNGNTQTLVIRLDS